MLANRLRKNLARLGPWAKREKLDAWRLYDRDIPEYPWSIDLYGSRVLLTEHVTPVAHRLSVEARESERQAVLEATTSVLKLPSTSISPRTRERHRSVEREAQGSSIHEFPVREREHLFLVNLDDYLDTGLFLDHRQARQLVGKRAAGKRVLNLFCYTGSFTVYAAKGGARETTSVDLSSPYLGWAERNLRLNGIDLNTHRLVREDVFAFLRIGTSPFDMIVLDPPTVSRSAKGKSFEIQKAHTELLQLCARRLAPDGWILLSTNDRAFTLESVPTLDAREIDTQSRDFRERAHRSWEIRRRQ